MVHRNNLRVDVVNNKVTGVNINGSDTNAASICNDSSFQIGDDVSQVYNACGSPDMVNNTYVLQAIPSTSKPEIWFIKWVNIKRQ